MQVTIIFGILFMLLNRKHVSRDQIAEKLEISTRTVSRYINYLSVCGVPVYTISGPNGGYCLPDDYILERAYLTREESGRIVTCLKAASSSFNDGMNFVLAEKISAIGSSQNDNFMLKSESIIIDAGAWNNPHVYNNKIQLLSRAIDNNVSVKFSYIDRHEYSTQRDFDPHCIVLKEGIWYAYGYCHSRMDFRLFKLARINNLIITADKFIRRKFDVYSKLKGNFDSNELVDFTIEFSNMILPEIEEWLGIDSISEKGTQYIATAQLCGGNVLLSKLMSFGANLKVISPASLREDILTECKRTLAIY